MRAVTYAKLGRVILAQPGQVAWQIYDAKVAKFVHGEYRTRRAARFTAEPLIRLLYGEQEDVVKGHDYRVLIRVIDDPGEVVNAIFDYYQQRGFYATSEERQLNLQL